MPFHFRAGLLDAAATEGYVAAMRSIGLKTLNDNPSEYVWLAAAAREGWLTPPTAPGSGPPPAPPPIMSLDQLLRELGEDRRDR